MAGQILNLSKETKMVKDKKKHKKDSGDDFYFDD